MELEIDFDGSQNEKRKKTTRSLCGSFGIIRFNSLKDNTNSQNSIMINRDIIKCGSRNQSVSKRIEVERG